MKTYKKLQIPKDSAWERKTWRRYVHPRIKDVFDGVSNLINWLPMIWKDRHWDDYYITKILQRKIELQRKYLIEHNRHTRIDVDNRDMTWVLNLLERKHEGYYELEKYDYEDSRIVFRPVANKPEIKEVDIEVKQEKWDEYLSKYPNAVRRIIKQYPDSEKDKQVLTIMLADYNQRRADNLLWKIMAERSANWWD